MIEYKDTHQQKKYRVLLIGDSCVDQYFWGEYTRISPEAPVPIFTIDYVTENAGMAANVCKNLQSFDIDVTFITNTEYISKARYIDKKTKQHLFRVDKDQNCQPLIDLPNCHDYDLIVVSDYDKGLITYDFLKKLRTLYKGTIFIDTKKSDLKQLDGFILKINKKEWQSAKSFSDDVIITLGEQGALYQGKRYPATEVDIFDVCGAGDTFLSALVAKYLESKSIDLSIKYANLAAAMSVKHFGVYVLTKKDIEYIDYQFDYIV